MSTSPDNFFTPLANTRPYFKAGLMGMAGSGKSTTMALLAIKLHQTIESTKPIVLFDTERAVKFLQPYFDAFGITVLVRDSRSLADWVETVNRCQSGAADILCIDSVTHLWEGLLKSHQEKVKRPKLQIDDWGIVKPVWKKYFSDPFLDSRVHIVMAGRAGDVWENEIDEESGRRKSFNTGVHKMKVEGETGFEPHLLVDLDLVRDARSGDEKSWREATVIKDRSNTIDGRTFRFENTHDARAAFAAVEKAFAPAIQAALAGATSASMSEEQSTRSLLETTDEGDRNKRDRMILLEEIEAYLMQAAPGQSAKEKLWRNEMLETLFGSPAWAKVEVLHLDVLRDGRNRLVDKVAELRRAKAESESQGLPFDPSKATDGGRPDQGVARESKEAPAQPAVEDAKEGAAPDAPSTSTVELSVVKPVSMLEAARIRDLVQHALQGRGFDTPSARRLEACRLLGIEETPFTQMTGEQLLRLEALMQQETTPAA